MKTVRKMKKGIAIRMTIDQAELIIKSVVAKRCEQSPGGVMMLQPSFKDGNYFFRAIYLERETALAVQDVMRKVQGIKTS